MIHMGMQKLLSKYQFGFIEKRSTTLQLLHVLEEWTDIMERGNEVEAIYMDFQKAFDTVPHKRLMSKLKSYGFGGKIVKWIENFLSNRSHKVVINRVESASAFVTAEFHRGVYWVQYCSLYTSTISQIKSKVKHSSLQTTPSYSEKSDPKTTRKHCSEI